MADKKQKMTRNQVVREIKRRVGESSSIIFMGTPDETSFVDSVYEIFGDWDAAFKAANLSPKTRLYNYWTEEEALKRLKEMVRKKEPINTVYLEYNHPRLWNAARRLFETIEKAVEAAGFSYKDVRKRDQWSDEEIQRRIRKYYKEGKDITQTAMYRLDSKLLAAGQNYYGAWSHAVQSAGLDYADVKGRRKMRKKAALRKAGTT